MDGMIRDLGTGYTIIGPQDRERYIRTFRVSTCTVLTLHFPQSRTAALVHILPSESLDCYLLQIKKDIEGKVDDAPFYAVESGPLYDPDFSRHKNPEIVQQYFTGAKPSNKIERSAYYKSTWLDVIIDKETGAVRISGLK